MNARWPAACVRVAVAEKLAGLRWQECGCMLQGVADEQLLVAGGSGTLSWQSVGAFRLAFDAEEAKAVGKKHVPIAQVPRRC